MKKEIDRIVKKKVHQTCHVKQSMIHMLWSGPIYKM